MEKVLIKNANIADVIEGGAGPGDIYLEDGVIKEVRPQMDAPEDAQVVDMRGKTVVPGLFNCHVHVTTWDPWTDPPAYPPQQDKDGGFMLMGLNAMYDLIRSGTTFCRDMGGRNYLDLELRNACNKGAFVGPDLIVSGKLIGMTGGHGWYLPGYSLQVDGVDEARHAARLQLRAGADCLKVLATGGVMTVGEPGAAQMNEDEMAAVVEEGDKVGAVVAAHAHGTQGIKNALRAGVHSIEHGIYMDEEAIAMMVEKGTWYVPTLAAVHFILAEGKGRVPDFAFQKAEEGYEHLMRSFEMARKAGVKIAAGTDINTPFNPPIKSPYELVLMVEAGATPLEALRYATINSAQLCRVDHLLGSITPGKKGHFAVFEKNPLEDIREIMNNVMTFKNGKIVYQKA